MASSNSVPYEQLQKDYDEQASMYNVLMKWPFGIFENQIFASAVQSGDMCKGASILDLGGGTGLRARQTLAAGATRVDVVDISDEMMAVGKKDAEALLGTEGSKRLRWFHGDASKQLFGEGGVLGLTPPYDVVLANWVFDHVDDPAVLEAMWRNISAAVRPGGWFVGVRACDPRCDAMISGKYGPTCQDFSEFPDGLYYSSTIPGVGIPDVHLKNASLKVSYSGSTEMHELHGFYDVQIEPCDHLDIVKADPEFWQSWKDAPGFVVVKARKR
ncbi:S-adenosyl-L-methionine-dependent methyltransferase [Periconia macrospinosa]|uniref:S-adenosyl-L-methionine-dependent methyltransferase n=1 Tax=Periconia macrospinosa TaxID=97972 RepID=A0A2V1DC78_9PLEO|nr:S-adenosyl-L-methionine-dependent methyltransferase [Periconia macrospinosa]